MVGKPAEAGPRPTISISPKPIQPRNVVELKLSREETLHYIAQITGELTILARASKLDVLAYFLEMARIEAASTDPDA